MDLIVSEHRVRSYPRVIQRRSDVLQEDVIVINGKGGSYSLFDRVLLSGLVSVQHIPAGDVIPHQHSYIPWRFLWVRFFRGYFVGSLHPVTPVIQPAFSTNSQLKANIQISIRDNRIKPIIGIVEPHSHYHLVMLYYLCLLLCNLGKWYL